MCRMQSGAAPESGTLQDLWSLHPASGPPLCLVGSFKKTLLIQEGLSQYSYLVIDPSLASNIRYCTLHGEVLSAYSYNFTFPETKQKNVILNEIKECSYQNSCISWVSSCAMH